MKVGYQILKAGGRLGDYEFCKRGDINVITGCRLFHPSCGGINAMVYDYRPYLLNYSKDTIYYMITRPRSDGAVESYNYEASEVAKTNIYGVALLTSVITPV
jgi:hypothetical protein